MLENFQKIEIPFQTDENFESLLKSLKYNQYKSSLFIYDEKLTDTNALRRINFSQKWMDITDINIFKFIFKEKEDAKTQQISDLCKSLKFNTNVKMLLLDGICNGDECIKSISSCLKINNSIKYLTLLANNIGENGAKLLSEALLSNDMLETLMLESNMIGPFGSKHLAESLEKNKSLLTIVLRGNKVGDTGAKYLGKMLKKNKSLQAIGLGDNNISDDGFYYICDGLKENKSMTHLWISENKITSIGAGFLSEILSDDPKLQSVWANGNRFGDEGAIYIADALKSNEILQTLTMDNNDIAEDGLYAIAESLKFNHSLVNIWLDGNRLTDNSFKKFAEALKFNPCLETFWVNGNEITSDGYDIFLRMLRTNESLQTILFGGEKLGEDYEKFISEVKKINEENKSYFDSFLRDQEKFKKVESNDKILFDESTESTNESECTGKNQKNEIEINLNEKNIIDFEKSPSEEKNSKEKIRKNSNKSDKDKEKYNKNAGYLDLTKISGGEKIQYAQIKFKDFFADKDCREITVEKCYKSFKYLNLMEKIFLNCLKVKKIFEDNNLSCIEKNFVDQINIDMENQINNQDLFESESIELNDLKNERKIRNKKAKKNENYEKYLKIRKDSYSNQTNLNTLDSDTSYQKIISRNSSNNSNNYKKEEININQEYDTTENYDINKNIIKFNEFEILKNEIDGSSLILQKGAYSKILLGLYWDQIITVKIIEINKIDKEKFLSEINFMIENPHDNINKIIGYCEIKSEIFLISHFNQCCNLYSLIHEKHLNIPVENLFIYISDIIHAINFLHKKNYNVLYKDLKLETVFITKEGKHAFLDNFGFSKHFFTNKTKNQKYCGTISYMSPELLRGEEFTLAADIYTFGIILYEIFSLKLPFENKSDIEIVKFIVAGNRPSLSYIRKDTPSEYIDLIMKCWQQDPLKRPSSDDIIYFMKK